MLNWPAGELNIILYYTRRWCAGRRLINVSENLWRVNVTHGVNWIGRLGGNATASTRLERIHCISLHYTTAAPLQHTHPHTVYMVKCGINHSFTSASANRTRREPVRPDTPITVCVCVSVSACSTLSPEYIVAHSAHDSCSQPVHRTPPSPSPAGIVIPSNLIVILLMASHADNADAVADAQRRWAAVLR